MEERQREQETASTRRCFSDLLHDEFWGGPVGMSTTYLGGLRLGSPVLEKWCLEEIYSMGKKRIYLL